MSTGPSPTLTGGGRLLPGNFDNFQDVFGGSNIAETTKRIYDISTYREIVLLTRITVFAGTPTTTIRVYFIDSKGNRYPATEGVGAAAAVITHSHTAAGVGRSVLNLQTDAAGLGHFLEITTQYTIGGVTPTSTLDVEVHAK